MYNCPYTNCGTNFEYLFATYNTTATPSSDPPSNSLFNIQNMQTLVNLGTAAPNILTTNQTAVYGVDFLLGDDWLTLTTALGLDDV